MLMCAKWVERKRRRLVDQEAWEVAVHAFKAYGHPLMMVSLFHYLSPTLTVVYNNCLAVVYNLHELWKVWSRLFYIMG